MSGISPLSNSQATNSSTYSTEVQTNHNTTKDTTLFDIGALPSLPLKQIVGLLASTLEGAGSLALCDRKVSYKARHGIENQEIGSLSDESPAPTSNTTSKLYPLEMENLIPETYYGNLEAYQTRLDELRKPVFSIRKEIVCGFIYNVQKLLETEHGVTPENFHSVMGQRFFINEKDDFASNLAYAVHIARALTLYNLDSDKPRKSVEILLHNDFKELKFSNSNESLKDGLKSNFSAQNQATLAIAEHKKHGSALMDLSCLCLHALPPHIQELTNCLSLDLTDNNLSSLPAGLADLKSLKYLIVDTNLLNRGTASYKYADSKLVSLFEALRKKEVSCFISRPLLRVPFFDSNFLAPGWGAY